MTLPQRRIGTRSVGAIGFGAMSLAGAFGAADDNVSMETLQAAVDAGIDFWDTANIYGMGRSETVVGRFLKQSNADIFLATKVGIIPGPPRRFGNSEDYIRSELEMSLTRLNRDRVELYYIHRRDPQTPVVEVAETMGKLIDEGLIGGWGLSEVAPFTIRQAHAVTPLTAVQNEYSLWSRQPELGVVRTCAQLGITFVPFSPVGRGALSDVDLDPPNFADSDFRKANPRFTEPNWSANMAQIRAFRTLAAARGVPTSALALAWVLAQGDHLIPIPGTRTAKHLSDLVTAASIDLSPADIADIDAVLPAGWAYGDRYSPTQVFGVESYS
ncbi:aldo/keto reductase [Celeribacter arenosi]|uniref:Aldo/keto reductase n=1 Tax=Celeribacter arenosi TaxID=792649 RepID=A0ABP7K3M9_9RHOB